MLTLEEVKEKYGNKPMRLRAINVNEGFILFKITCRDYDIGVYYKIEEIEGADTDATDMEQFMIYDDKCPEPYKIERVSKDHATWRTIYKRED